MWFSAKKKSVDAPKTSVTFPLARAATEENAAGRAVSWRPEVPGLELTASPAARNALTCDIDESLSWSLHGDEVAGADDLTADLTTFRSGGFDVQTQTLACPPLHTTRVPIKLPRLRAKTNGFLFPEAASWI